MKNESEIAALFQRRPAVHQLCVGSWLQTPFHLGEEVWGVPLRSLGFSDQVRYLANFTSTLVNARVEVSAVEALLVESKDAQPVVALCLPLTIDAACDDLEALAAPRLDRARAILTWVSSTEVTPIGMVTATTERTYFRPMPPPYSQRQQLFGIGGTYEAYQATLERISGRALRDERFAFALSLYHDAIKESNVRFRIGRMFNVLEALAHRLKSGVGSRQAVRQMLGLEDGASVEVVVEEKKYRFDAIEIAGRIRDKLFHGVPFEARNLNDQTRSIFDLYQAHPEFIANPIERYCELELNRWANGASKGQVESESDSRDR